MSAEGGQKKALKRIAQANLAPDGRHTLKLTPLGAGQEVGRSCILLEFKEKRVLVSGWRDVKGDGEGK